MKKPFSEVSLTEAELAETKQLLSKHKFFINAFQSNPEFERDAGVQEGASLEENKQFVDLIQAIARKLTSRLYCKAAVLCNKYDIGEEMFIIDSGTPPSPRQGRRLHRARHARLAGTAGPAPRPAAHRRARQQRPLGRGARAEGRARARTKNVRPPHRATTQTWPGRSWPTSAET